MKNTLSIVLAALIGAFVWEVGHPYIPGVVVDHHTHEECD